MNDYWLTNTGRLTWHTRGNDDVGDKENCSSISTTDGRALSSCSSNVQRIDYGMMRWSKMLRLTHLQHTEQFFKLFFLFTTAVKKGFAQTLMLLHNAHNGMSIPCIIPCLERRQWWSEIRRERVHELKREETERDKTSESHEAMGGSAVWLFHSTSTEMMHNSTVCPLIAAINIS